MKDAGFLVLRGNLFDSAIMKTSVISGEFRDRYLNNSKDLNAFEGRAIVVEGPEDYHDRIDDPSLDIDEHCMLFIRGTGPIGYPGGAEVVNMQPPAALIKRGVLALPCIGDGRQSGTSGSPSILNASPEAAADGGLAILKTGDMVRIDLNKGSANILISDEEIKKRHADLKAKGGFPRPAHQTPWQELFVPPSASTPPAPAWSSPRAITTSPARSAWRGITTDGHCRCPIKRRHSWAARRAEPGMAETK
jgi:dihydroxy-acid dehydratase